VNVTVEQTSVLGSSRVAKLEVLLTYQPNTFNMHILF